MSARTNHRDAENSLDSDNIKGLPWFCREASSEMLWGPQSSMFQREILHRLKCQKHKTYCVDSHDLVHCNRAVL